MRTTEYRVQTLLLFALLFITVLPALLMGQTPEANHRVDPEHGSGFSVGTLIEPAGMLTLGLLLATAALGIFRKQIPRRLNLWHRRLGLAAVVMGLLHAIFLFMVH